MASTRVDLAWALVRVTFGGALAGLHGMGKVFGGIPKFEQTVAALGLPYPTAFAWAAGLAEFAGGILVALGLLTRPAAAAAAVTMGVALYKHRMDPPASMEKAGLYLAVMLAAVLIGGGRFSLDARWKRIPRWLK